MTDFNNFAAYLSDYQRFPIFSEDDRLFLEPLPPRQTPSTAEMFHIHHYEHLAILATWLAYPKTTVVTGTIPLAWTSDQRSDLSHPTILISFQAKPDEVQTTGRYAIDDQEKPPDSVLAVTPSPTQTAHASMGVSDYCLLQPQEAQPLSGWQLAYGQIPAHPALPPGQTHPFAIRPKRQQKYSPPHRQTKPEIE